MRISDWSSDVCSSDLPAALREPARRLEQEGRLADPRIAADQRRRPSDEAAAQRAVELRSEEHTSELQSLMRIPYAVFCLKKKNSIKLDTHHNRQPLQTHHNTPPYSKRITVYDE